MKQPITLAAAALLAASLLFTPLRPAAAGAAGGPKTSGAETVLARDTDTYEVTFRGREEAVIRAIGDGDIDLYVYDSAGRRVASDNELDDIPVVVFTPEWTETYTIRLVNSEHYAVGYVLETN